MYTKNSEKQNCSLRHGVYESTVRRKIKAGALMTERVNGKWHIESEPVDRQVDGQVDGNQDALVTHLTAEVEYLRSQLDKQTTFNS